MRRRMYNSAEQASYETRVVEIVDPETGEVMPAIYTDKRIYGSESFLKMTPLWGKTSLRAFAQTSYVVLIYIISKMRRDTNTFTGTWQNIQDETGLSRPSVIRGLKWAMEYDFIRPVRRSTWMVNPYMLAAGSNIKIRQLRTLYDTLKRSEPR